MRIFESRSSSRLKVEDPTHVGEFRRNAQRLAEANQLDQTLIGRVGIVATELANNIVKHAGRGELLLQAIVDQSSVTIELISIDQGRGMHVEACMRDGFSTSGTPGTGLGAIKRLSSVFDAYSVVDQGTVVVSRIAKQEPRSAPKAPEFGAICLAVAGEIECGDTWRIAAEQNRVGIMVADGLGHGPLAATASRAAAMAFSEQPFAPPAQAMQLWHDRLSGSRGAAGACALVDSEKNAIDYGGVGNIAGCVVSAERSKGMVSHNGILGVQLLRKQQFEYAFPPSSRLVMHSDGLSARWSLAAYPGLLGHHSAVFAAVLYRDHARVRDDVTIVVSNGVP